MIRFAEGPKINEQERRQIEPGVEAHEEAVAKAVKDHGLAATIKPLAAEDIRKIAGEDAMVEKKPRLRFAPSPTGHLHIGGARTALMNAMFAQRTGGEFVLRIEDTDQLRSRAEYTQAILDGLKWLGIKWSGEPVFQSQRAAIYNAKVDKLLAENKAYKDASGAVWFRMPTEGALVVNDRVKGKVVVNIKEENGSRDIVIRRADGNAGFLFANVVDDGEMGITHVIRGDDHLTNAGKQVALFQALGYEMPIFYHVGLIHGDDGKKLSKRHGATSVIDYQKLGYDPTALVNHLARLGMRVDTLDTLPIDELSQKLDVWGFGKSYSQLNLGGLASRNRTAIGKMSVEEVSQEIKKRDPALSAAMGEAGVAALADAARNRAATFAEVVQIGKFVREAPLAADEDKIAYLTDANSRLMEKIAERLSSSTATTAEEFETELKAFNQEAGIGFADYQKALRFGLTGLPDGLPLHHTIAILGRDEAVKRLRAAYEFEPIFSFARAAFGLALTAKTKAKKYEASTVADAAEMLQSGLSKSSWASRAQVVLTPENARAVYDDMTSLKKAIAFLREAIGGAKSKELTQSFPEEQIDEIEQRLNRDIEAFKAKASTNYQFAPSIRLAPKTDLAGNAARLAKSLDAADLTDAMTAAVAKVPAAARAEFESNVTAMTMLVDDALNAPDYQIAGHGWQYPASRADHRQHRFDALTSFQSSARITRSKNELREMMQTALTSDDPASAMERALIRAFAGEVSAQGDNTDATAAGVRSALDHELLLPLRSINEAVPKMSEQTPELRQRIATVVNTITEHVLSGDYKEWRYGNPVALEQQRALTPAQRKKWQGPLSTEAGTLKTREEDGLDLFWVTKIGGPSHGFDYGPNCLLPLLANARTKAILVDDARAPGNAAARAYVRLLEKDGKPVLYLEPLQRDFPHRAKFDAAGEDRAFYKAIVSHAMAKAKQMGVPLSLPPALGDPAYGGIDVGALVKELGGKFTVKKEKYWLSESAGIFEASDTLTEKHDWPQLQGEMTPTLGRIVVAK